MTLVVGTAGEPAKVFYGAATVSAVYTGAQQVWPSASLVDGPRLLAVSPGTDGQSAASWTIGHDAPSGSYVLLATGAYQGEVPDSATYGGVPMVKIGEKTTGSRGAVSFWGLADAPAGAQDCTVTRVGQANIVMTVASFADVAAIRVGGPGGSFPGGTQPASMIETCDAGERIVQAFGYCYIPEADRPAATVSGGTPFYSRFGGAESTPVTAVDGGASLAIAPKASMYGGLTMNHASTSPTTFTAAKSGSGLCGLAVILS